MPKVQVNQITSQTGGVLTVGQSGDTVTLATGATSSGFGATYNGAINWSSTIRTSGFTAVSGNGYFCNTTSGAFTVTLPASPSAGNVVAFKDYAKTWNTNNLTIGRNGSNIEGLAQNAIQSTQGQSITLIYVDSTKGWVVIDSGLASEAQVPLFVAATGGTITTCGNYKIHTFNSSGCFVVSCVGNSVGSNSVEYLVVAGGAGGGGAAQVSTAGGGGGAGGFRQNYPSPTTAGLPVTATTYPITVGSGGAGQPGFNTGSPGSNSIFSTITSAGGGGGGTYQINGISGGSGGGGGAFSPTGLAGGAGNTPPVSPPQGNPGGPTTASTQNSTVAGGGGGGSGGTGGTGSPNTGGTGGAGTATSISGTSVTYAAGGGGSGNTPGAAGNPSAGAGATGPTGNGSSASSNQGGGGGGGITGPSGTNTGGSGGSGIVVIRYKYQ